MQQLIAIVNVVAWGGFWAFGYIALTSSTVDSAHMVTATLLAALGAGIGLWAYFRLVRHSEQTGYAKRPNRAQQREEEVA